MTQMPVDTASAPAQAWTADFRLSKIPWFREGFAGINMDDMA
jgi:hypothetical protein